MCIQYMYNTHVITLNTTHVLQMWHNWPCSKEVSKKDVSPTFKPKAMAIAPFFRIWFQLRSKTSKWMFSPKMGTHINAGKI